MASLNCLNDDCLMEIFQYFNTPMDHLCVSKVCKRWQFLMEDRCLKLNQNLCVRAYDNVMNRDTMAVQDFYQLLKLYGSSVEKIIINLRYLCESSNVYAVEFNNKYTYNSWGLTVWKMLNFFMDCLPSVRTIDLCLPECADLVYSSIELCLAQMEELENLNFFGYVVDCNIRIPESLRSLSFNIKFTETPFDLISYIKKATELEELKIECQWSKEELVTDELFDSLSKWATQLKILQLYSDTHSTFRNVGKLCNLINLQELQLRGITFSDEDLRAIGSSCKKLKELAIPHSFQETSEVVLFLKSLPNLETIQLI